MNGYSPKGTVIHGTHRPQDLLCAFLIELRNATIEVWGSYAPGDKRPEWRPESCLTIPNKELLGSDARIVDDHPWWNSEHCQECINDLMDAIDAKAPEGMYFGAHPGDGSDFGYWPIEEDS